MSDKRDRVTIWLDGMAADLRDEDRFAHGEAWNPQQDRGLGRCAYCPGDQPWPCEWQQKVDRLGEQVAHIRAVIVADSLDAAWAEAVEELAAAWWRESQGDKTIIRDAGILQRCANDLRALAEKLRRA